MKLFGILKKKDTTKNKSNKSKTPKPETNYLFSHFIDDLSYYSPEYNRVMLEIQGLGEEVGSVRELNVKNKELDVDLTPLCMEKKDRLVLVSSLDEPVGRYSGSLYVDTMITKNSRHIEDISQVRFRNGGHFYEVIYSFNDRKLNSEDFSTITKCSNLMLARYLDKSITYTQLASIILMSLTQPITQKFNSSFKESHDSSYRVSSNKIIFHHYVKTPENEEKVKETVELASVLIHAHRGAINFKDKPRELIEAYMQLEACIRILKNLDYYPETQEVLAKLEKVKAVNINNIELSLQISNRARESWKDWSKEDRQQINDKLTEIYDRSFQEMDTFFKELEGVLDNITTSIERVQLKDKHLDELLSQLD